MKRLCCIISILLFTINGFANDPVYGWDYKYRVTAPNTRSESVYGTLLFKGHELPKEFDRVVTPIGEFAFISTLGWLPVGKYPDKTDKNMRVASTKQDVEELLSGTDPDCRFSSIKEVPTNISTEAYVEGTFEKPPKGVGPDWFYVVGKSLWVNPQKIDEVLKAKYGPSK
ncbi:MAG TPA: hypothetical protein VG733_16050 [Chthoniobacteraceae bacterium]|nr:hypothetical protein [Chthoniobacteraceae bacterium]